MTTINIYSGAQEGGPKELSGSRQLRAAAKKIGILSSIDLVTTADNLLKAFLDGYGSTSHKPRKGGGATKHDRADLQTKRNELVNTDNCTILALVGGLVVHEAASDSEVPFVSLVGSAPSSVEISEGTTSRGGVTLESWQQNATRVTLAAGRLGIAANDPTLFALYQHPDSTMRTKESDNWRVDVFGGAANTIVLQRAANGNYANDFNALPNTVRALIISADAVFREERNALVTAANGWIAAGGGVARCVIYPLQDYERATPSPTNCTLHGPDLLEAYRLLGIVARYAAETDLNAGFFPIYNHTKSK